MRWKAKRGTGPDKRVYVAEGLDRQLEVEVYRDGDFVIMPSGERSTRIPPGAVLLDDLSNALSKYGVDKLPPIPKIFTTERKLKPGKVPIL